MTPRSSGRAEARVAADRRQQPEPARLHGGFREHLSPDRQGLPADYTFVAESGLGDHADLDQMAERGVHCFLIGEALMRQHDVEAATRALVG